MLLFWIFLYEWIQISTIQSSAQKTGELSQSLAHLLMRRKMFLKAPMVSSRVREWPSGRVDYFLALFLRDTSNLFQCYDLVLQDELNVLKIGIKDEMEQFPSLITNVKDLKRKKELENLISVYDEGEARFLVMKNPSDHFSHFSSVHDTWIALILQSPSLV